MNETKKELEVAALENGIVIDHIPSETLFQVVSLLGLDKLSGSITIGNNLISKKIGKKGIIKIADCDIAEEDINRIALLAPDAKINTIRDYKVVEKRPVTLPEKIVGIVKCGNPKCITNNEPMKSVFHVVSRDPLTLKCHYCERTQSRSDIEIRR